VHTADPHLSPPADDIVRSLVGAPITDLVPIRRGRNSGVYRVRSRGSTFALKRYPSRLGDAHDRLTTEVDALRLMRQHKLDAVPNVIALDRDHGLVLLSWIGGSPVIAVDNFDVDQAVRFLTAVHMLRQTCSFAEDRHAAEACLAGAEIERQIAARLKRLAELPAAEESLHEFLQTSFRPAFDQLVALARGRMRGHGLDFDTILPQEQRTLVPSDFGFHNMLRRPDGTLAFFDFEYFGWDDPVKLTADVLLHPGTPILLPQRQRFRHALEGLYGQDPTFRPRLNALYPLFALRWALIVLNEFLPDRWHRRIMAGARETWEAAKQEQLAQAHQYLRHLAAEELQGVTHGE